MAGRRRRRNTADPKAAATTILQQLGGLGRITAMLGKPTLGYSSSPKGPYLSMRFKSPHRGPNHVKITLTPADTYDVDFSKLHGYNVKPAGSYTDIYAEQLKPLFERVTGLYLSMGTMGRRNSFDPRQMRMGIRVEHEHTTSSRVARKIAGDHLAEFGDYYTRLAKMEKRAKAGLKPNRRRNASGYYLRSQDYPSFDPKQHRAPEEAVTARYSSKTRYYGPFFDDAPDRDAALAQVTKAARAAVLAAKAGTAVEAGRWAEAKRVRDYYAKLAVDQEYDDFAKVVREVFAAIVKEMPTRQGGLFDKKPNRRRNSAPYARAQYITMLEAVVAGRMGPYEVLGAQPTDKWGRRVKSKDAKKAAVAWLKAKIGPATPQEVIHSFPPQLRGQVRSTRRNSATADWVLTAQDLLDASLADPNARSQDDLHYRAYLRGVVSGLGTHSHLAAKFPGAKRARAALIDEWGKGKHKPNRRRNPSDAARTYDEASHRYAHAIARADTLPGAKRAAARARARVAIDAADAALEAAESGKRPNRRRNAKAKKPTFASAQATLLAALAASGWSVKSGLMVPHATLGDVRLYFKPQAVYLDRAAGKGQKFDLKTARSLHLPDIRDISPAKFVAYAESL